MQHQSAKNEFSEITFAFAEAANIRVRMTIESALVGAHLKKKFGAFSEAVPVFADSSVFQHRLQQDFSCVA